jgi:hypothetical protein
MAAVVSGTAEVTGALGAGDELTDAAGGSVAVASARPLWVAAALTEAGSPLAVDAVFACAAAANGGVSGAGFTPADGGAGSRAPERVDADADGSSTG